MWSRSSRMRADPNDRRARCGRHTRPRSNSSAEPAPPGRRAAATRPRPRHPAEFGRDKIAEAAKDAENLAGWINSCGFTRLGEPHDLLWWSTREAHAAGTRTSNRRGLAGATAQAAATRRRSRLLQLAARARTRPGAPRTGFGRTIEPAARASHCGADAVSSSQRMRWRRFCRSCREHFRDCANWTNREAHCWVQKIWTTASKMSINGWFAPMQTWSATIASCMTDRTIWKLMPPIATNCGSTSRTCTPTSSACEIASGR